MQEQGKTGGPPSTPVDTLSSQVLPLIENELEPVDNPWDCDSDLHSQSVLEESDPSIEPECIAAPSAESEYHSVATPEPDHLSGTIAMPQPSDVPSLEPESLEGPSGEPEPIAASSIEPGRAHESCATVTDDSSCTGCSCAEGKVHQKKKSVVLVKIKRRHLRCSIKVGR
ncbi:uncharacterized protein [Procambarus clarkii]|uniref:uncharacterized protein isoform X4 n=1 Tax=Procambarus clarkii TaxID=6728 RepID=UPI003742A5A9